jgi:transposase
MLVVETIGRIRREHFVQGKSIKEIARELRLSRNTVRKVLRSGETSFSYERQVQPRPKPGRWKEDLDRLLARNAEAAARERLTLIRLFEELRALGYGGGYDAVRRYAGAWAKTNASATASAFVPLMFAPGEAYQFDWSHEIVVLDGVTTIVKVAHVRLCHSRMMFVRAYPRETQEMVFDAHERAFAFFKGACGRGIYDNMKTAVETIFVGKDRQYNRRFLQMCSHHLVEPVACTPASGWEKGQVENQVGLVRERFTPRLRFKSYDELNAWLLDKCLSWAKAHAHPERPEQTIWEVFEEERPRLIPYRGRFDGFHALPASVSKTCLVRFDNNKYSVSASAVGRPVDIHAYADRIVIRQDGRVVAEHRRSYGRGATIYDPWRRGPIAQLHALANAYAGPHEVATIYLGLFPPGSLGDADVSHTHEMLRKRLDRAGFKGAIVVGGIEVAWQENWQRWLLHAQVLAIGVDPRAWKRLEVALKKSGTAYPVDPVALRNPDEQLSYCIKFVTYHRPGRRRVPLPPDRLVELAAWCAPHRFEDFLFAYGARRRGGRLVVDE